MRSLWGCGSRGSISLVLGSRKWFYCIVIYISIIVFVFIYVHDLIYFFSIYIWTLVLMNHFLVLINPFLVFIDHFLLFIIGCIHIRKSFIDTRKWITQILIVHFLVLLNHFLVFVTVFTNIRKWIIDTRKWFINTIKNIYKYYKMK